MPKLPSNPQGLPLRELSDRLDQVRISLAELADELSKLTFALYTKGLDQRGPLRETSDDVPF
jgi:hypothetical protein